MGRVAINCEQCGKVKHVWPSAATGGKGRFCSRKCTAISTGAKSLIIARRVWKAKPRGPRIDLTGRTFNQWKVLAYSHTGRASYWRVECINCGAESVKCCAEIKSGRGSRSGCRQCFGRAKGHVGLSALFYAYRLSARRAGRRFALNLQSFQALTSAPCHYCAAPPSQLASRKAKTPWGAYVYSGIDRMDNAQGYVAGNCVPCCGVCNTAKGGMSYADFVAHIRALVANAATIACLTTGSPTS